MTDRSLVIASNRGPIAFSYDSEGRLQAKRGAGGLVSGLAPLMTNTDSIWFAAALSSGDRDAAQAGVIEVEGLKVRYVDIDPADLKFAYDVISNETLWMLHHGMFDSIYEPVFDAAWHRAWVGYRSFNQAYADALISSAPRAAIVLVQDYHLTLVAAMAASTRPDLSFIHFSHTPFATRAELELLPQPCREEMMRGLSSYDACGFHTQRWADQAIGCATGEDFELTTFVAPLGPDESDLRKVADGNECSDAIAGLLALIRERKFLVRVDRIELSKNIVRGFLAYEAMLEAHPELRGEVVFGAFLYPSRESVDAYRIYHERVAATVASINERFSTADWQPIVFETDDDFPRSLAALRLADAVVVNPLRDGMNLVAKEAVLLSDKASVICVSSGAGAHRELVVDDGALEIDAFDIVSAAETLYQAIVMAPVERQQRHERLLSIVRGCTPKSWLTSQVAQATA